MKKTFKRLCLICFCIVLAAVPLGIFELVYLDKPNSTFLGCAIGEFASFHCGHGVTAAIKEIVLNLPFGFMIAPLFALRPPPLSAFVGVPDKWWSAYPFLVALHHPLFVYLYTLDMILILALVHIVTMIIALTKRLLALIAK